MAAVTSSSFEIKSTVRVFNGSLIRFVHQSKETKTLMTCAVYLPSSSSSSSSETFPTLLYLSGLTCTDENVCQKCGPLFQHLSQKRMAFVAPDTSPRGAGIVGETDSWDFGVGAGFYVDATASPWSNNYRMYSYITEELMTVLKTHFPSLDLHHMGISGHSMGGHGALNIALKNPSLFKSVSAFAPICNPKQCPWGQKALGNYLATPEEADAYDACALVTTRGKSSVYDDILIDVGTADTFYKQGQLMPEAFAQACAGVGQPVTIRYQDDYDHSYYFVSSFIEEHLEYHRMRLTKSEV